MYITGTTGNGIRCVLNRYPISSKISFICNIDILNRALLKEDNIIEISSILIKPKEVHHLPNWVAVPAVCSSHTEHACKQGFLPGPCSDWSGLRVAVETCSRCRGAILTLPHQPELPTACHILLEHNYSHFVQIL